MPVSLKYFKHYNYTHTCFLYFVCQYVCVSVHLSVGVSAPKAFSDWLNKFYGFPHFQLLFKTLSVDKMDGRGLISTCCECLPKKAEVTWY